MSTPQHPDWIAGVEPPPPDPVPAEPETPKPSARPTSSTTRPTAQTRATVAAEGTVIPIAYGRLQLGAKVFAVATDETTGLSLIGCIWCLGEIEEIECVMDGDTEIVDRVDYLGTTTQVADPWLAAAIDGYADTLVWESEAGDVGVAYSVLRVNTSSSSPRPVATVKAKLVYDPDLDDTVYSDCPALALADFETSLVYGEGRAIDWDSVSAVKAANNELLADGSKRRTLGLSIDRVASVENHRKTLELYAGCWVVSAVDYDVKLIVDGPGDTVFDFTPDIIVEGSVRIQKTGRKDAPTVVTVNYTETVDEDGAELTEWRDASATVKAPGVDAGTKAWRETRIGMTGITNAAQAYREATQHLNRYLLTDLEVEFTAMDEALDVTAGDLTGFQHPLLGSQSKPMRAEYCKAAAPGRWSVRLYEHDNGVYSDEILTQPGYTDTNLPSPLNPPAPTSLVLSEEIYQLQNGTYSSRIKAVWGEPTFAYTQNYRVTLKGGLDPDTGEQTPEALFWMADTLGLPTGVAGERYTVAGPVQEGAVMTVSVETVSTAGTASDALFDQITPAGKYLIPGDVPVLSAVQIGADTVRLTWQAAADIDIWQYEVRTGDSWDSGTVLDRVDGLSLLVSPLPSGAHLFYVKAIDSVGNYSENPATASLTVALPPDVTGFDGFEVGGTVYLNWDESASIFVQRYEVRWADVGLTWDEANLIDIVDATTLTTTQVPQGTWMFFIKAVDTAGVRSENAVEKQISVSLDSGSFLLGAFNIERPNSADNMEGWWHRPEGFGAVLEDVFREEFYLGTLDGWTTQGTWTPTPGKVSIAWPQGALAVAYLTSDTKFAYDPRLQYQFEAVIRVPDSDTANCILRIGYIGYDDTGTAVDIDGNANGSGSHLQHYHCLADAGVVHGDRVTITGYTLGQNNPGDRVPVDPAAVCHPNVTQLAASVMVSNASCPAAGMNVEIESLRVRVRAPDVMHYVTDMGDTPAALWPATMDTYTGILATYHTSGNCEWLSTVFDVGLLVTGDWSVEMGISELSATVTAQLELSEDGTSWDTYTELAAKTTARYARLRVSGTGSATAHVFSTVGVLRVNAIPLVENGVVTTGAGGKVTVTLQNEYTAVKAVVTTPYGVTAAHSSVVDNVSLGDPTTFDIYVFDSTDTGVSGVSVSYRFEGV